MTYIKDLKILKEIELFEKSGEIIDKELYIIETEHKSRINFINNYILKENENSSSLENFLDLEINLYIESTESLWQKFKKWVKNIIKAIFGNKAKIPKEVKDSNEEIELDYDPKERLNFIQKIIKTVKNNKTKFTIGSSALVGTGLLLGIKKYFSKNKKTKVNASEIMFVIDLMDKTSKDMELNLNVTEEDSSKDPENQNWMMKFGRIILSEIHRMSSTLSSKLGYNSESKQNAKNAKNFKAKKALDSSIKSMITNNPVFKDNTNFSVKYVKDNVAVVTAKTKLDDGLDPKQVQDLLYNLFKKSFGNCDKFDASHENIGNHNFVTTILKVRNDK